MRINFAVPAAGLPRRLHAGGRGAGAEVGDAGAQKRGQLDFLFFLAFVQNVLHCFCAISVQSHKIGMRISCKNPQPQHTQVEPVKNNRLTS